MHVWHMSTCTLMKSAKKKSLMSNIARRTAWQIRWVCHILCNICCRYSFIGSTAHCARKGACASMGQWGSDGKSSPNNNAEADGMASIISHELTEAVTDPELNAWRAPRRCQRVWPRVTHGALTAMC